MFRVFEQYLEQLGERRGMLLLAAVLVWASIVIAIFAYGLGMGAIAAWRVSYNAYEAIVAVATNSAFGEQGWEIFLGVVVWILLLMMIFPLLAARRVWRRYRRQQLRAQKALSRLEEKLFPATERTSNVHSAHERLARRALDDIERRATGATQAAELTIEERLTKLDG